MAGVEGWVIGTVCTVIGAFFSTVGNISMKWAQNIEDERIAQGYQSRRLGSLPITNKWWWFGFITLVILPTPLEAIALSAAGQSLIYPLGGGLTIVFSQLLAPYFISGEKLTRLDWMATFTIVTGIVVTVAFGTHADTKFTVDELLALFRNRILIFWFFIVFSCNGAVMFFWRTRRAIMLEKYPRLTVFLLGYVAAAWCGIQGIVMKNTGELVKTSMSDIPEGQIRPFQRFEAWVFLLSVPVIGFVQLIYLNYGFQNFPAVKFIPIYNTQVVIIPAITGAIYFQEYKAFHPIAFPFGIFLVACGIMMLTYKAGSIQPIGIEEGNVNNHNGVGGGGGGGDDDDDSGVLRNSRDPVTDVPIRTPFQALVSDNAPSISENLLQPLGSISSNGSFNYMSSNDKSPSAIEMHFVSEHASKIANTDNYSKTASSRSRTGSSEAIKSFGRKSSNLEKRFSTTFENANTSNNNNSSSKRADEPFLHPLGGGDDV